jgi:hypothetical protein
LTIGEDVSARGGDMMDKLLILHGESRKKHP